MKDDFEIPKEWLTKPETPDSCKDTDGYLLDYVLLTPMELRQVTNLATGGMRNRRWGMMLGVNVVPELDTSPAGPVLLPLTPMQFIDADSLDELSERAKFEIDVAIGIAKKLRERQIQEAAASIAGKDLDKDAAPIYSFSKKDDLSEPKTPK